MKNKQLFLICLENKSKRLLLVLLLLCYAIVYDDPLSQLKDSISNHKNFFMGLGKEDLLVATNHFVSISAAAMHIEISSKRAWDLADVINTKFN